MQCSTLDSGRLSFAFPMSLYTSGWPVVAKPTWCM